MHTVLHAFQRDLHLELRPDDVWQVILAQFNFYINAHAKELRSVFVQYGGQKKLFLDIDPFCIWDCHVGTVAQRPAKMVKGNRSDPDMADWLLPKFTTTCDDDRSRMAMMLGHHEDLLLL